ncbi:DUF4864 domain-containing protein [Pseudooceanicola sp. MF1-13]|uniref:DUF4864 domain-containing protein n=1 Tax=Pseudooceanicola sp. MF1-13 TaxID=3379095 RepID=UPI003891FAB7
MRLFLAPIAALCLTLSAAPTFAQTNAPSDVITNQFDAFRDGDLPRAFSYASPMLQRYFRTPQNFGFMVQHGYSMVIDPDQMRMLDAREEGERVIQRVEVIDRKGVVHLLDYEMVETEDGWKINGVEFVKAPPMAV